MQLFYASAQTAAAPRKRKKRRKMKRVNQKVNQIVKIANKIRKKINPKIKIKKLLKKSESYLSIYFLCILNYLRLYLLIAKVNNFYKIFLI